MTTATDQTAFDLIGVSLDWVAQDAVAHGVKDTAEIAALCVRAINATEGRTDDRLGFVINPERSAGGEVIPIDGEGLLVVLDGRLDPTERLLVAVIKLEAFAEREARTARLAPGHQLGSYERT